MPDVSASRTPGSVHPSMGKYHPFARLGDGGMADVFLAVARGPAGFNKLAVVKRLRNAQDQLHVKMFLDEARLTARLNHPNIVDTYEVGETDGRFFIAMEYLEGEPLSHVVEWLRERREGLSDGMAAFLVGRALEGLHYAHDLADYDGTPLGIVHRDVSPQNLFVTYRGEVKLLDFGIAKTRVNATHTETGVLKGKIRYMAPEQVAEKDVDRRLDVFAAGVVLWEILARRPLWEGDSISILTRIANETAPSVRTFRPEIDPELDAIVAKALRRDRNERYATAEEMQRALDQLARKHAEDASTTAVARLMDRAFAAKRDTARARIQQFLARLPAGSSDGAIALTDPTDSLPALLADGSGPTRLDSAGEAPKDRSGTRTSTRIRAAQKRTRSIVAIASAIAIGAVATFAMRGEPRAPAPAAPAAPLAASAAPAPATAHLHLQTDPPGALVAWNGRSLDRTPIDVDLPPGEQTLAISRDGYEPESITVDARSGAMIDRALALRAVPPPEPSVTAPPRPAPAAPRPRPPRAAPSATTTATAAPTASAPLKIKVIDDTP